MNRPAPSTHTAPEPAQDLEDLGPSKSQRKRDSHALQALGERLVGLPESRLAALDLPDDLRDAIALARRITAHEGRRRQLQYVGKLMRRIDPSDIEAALGHDDERHRAETAVMHAAERWRDALIADPKRLSEFVTRYPQALARNLHPLIRSACTEHSKGQRGRHFRDLYRELRQVLLNHSGLGASNAQAQATDTSPVAIPPGAEPSY
ncbi:MAG: ribosome biogenesis factor YjgA [Burkholderiales bacterium]|jgi:ribosome-associated protein